MGPDGVQTVVQTSERRKQIGEQARAGVSARQHRSYCGNVSEQSQHADLGPALVGHEAP
eukprot:NODE_2513_length_467_cov_595.019139_g2075_i0.p4 GENE.NODE_2513_length_467_cov_595.019139_g2075_i0~~NODE_2513_length_467_cov_595.019139_g2075_i0.p4  ORF type:complete len:68 (-),score=22.52 NODE_2513_length_467_cov_595.019139_g2075_i0:264-440(-)